jgi:hypothetical protein
MAFNPELAAKALVMVKGSGVLSPVDAAAYVLGFCSGAQDGAATSSGEIAPDVS